MITADTITDEQIRELMGRSAARMLRGADAQSDRDALLVSEVALGLREPRVVDLQTARARCAEILNARAKESK